MEVFKYLGRLIAFDDDDTQVVRGTLRRPAASRRGSHVFCGQRTRLPAYVAYFIKPPYNLSFFREQKMGVVARYVVT